MAIISWPWSGNDRQICGGGKDTGQRAGVVTPECCANLIKQKMKSTCCSSFSSCVERAYSHLLADRISTFCRVHDDRSIIAFELFLR